MGVQNVTAGNTWLSGLMTNKDVGGVGEGEAGRWLTPPAMVTEHTPSIHRLTSDISQLETTRERERARRRIAEWDVPPRKTIFSELGLEEKTREEKEMIEREQMHRRRRLRMWMERQTEQNDRERGYSYSPIRGSVILFPDTEGSHSDDESIEESFLIFN